MKFSTFAALFALHSVTLAAPLSSPMASIDRVTTGFPCDRFAYEDMISCKADYSECIAAFSYCSGDRKMVFYPFGEPLVWRSVDAKSKRKSH